MTDTTAVEMDGHAAYEAVTAAMGGRGNGWDALTDAERGLWRDLAKVVARAIQRERDGARARIAQLERHLEIATRDRDNALRAQIAGLDAQTALLAERDDARELVAEILGCLRTGKWTIRTLAEWRERAGLVKP